MNEPQRLRYLHALGIDSYVSRRQLPGAAKTRRLALVRAETAAVAEQGLPPSPVASQRPRVELPKRQPRADSPAPVVAPQPSAPRPATNASLRFSVAAMFAGGIAWVETLEGSPLAREQVRLVQAMARAVHGEAEMPKVAHFDWPMHNNHQLDQGIEAARAALAAFLQRHIEEQHCRGLVLLGANGRDYLGERGLEGFATLTTLSTHEMLRDPARKRQVWADLQQIVLRA